MNLRMVGQELVDRRSFVRGEVVGDQVDFFALGLTRYKLGQKIDKFSTV